MKPLMADPAYRTEFPQIDECSLRIFGITADQAEAFKKPDDWDDIERELVSVQVSSFEDVGWDLTDNKRRPLRVFHHFNQQLWLAIRGVAGLLPFQPDNEMSSDLETSLAREAARFRRR